MSKPQGITLIVGGTGKTGRRVAGRLLQQGIPLRIASRTAEPPFEWHAPSTWGAVLSGVESVYLAYYPDLAAPGAEAQLRAFSVQAVASGVRRIVLLSGRGEEGARRSEQAVLAAGIPCTILRCAFFCQNFSEGALLASVLEGQVAFPAGQVREPFVDLDDVADVAVASLIDRRHDGEIYELSGPRLLTFAEAAEELSRATGREIAYVPSTFAQFGDALAAHVPGPYVQFLTQLFEQIFDGHNAHLSDGVARALGRPARDFRDFARAAARAGAWDAPQPADVFGTSGSPSC